MTAITNLQQMIIAPYEPALAVVTDANSLIEWNRQIFPNRFEAINQEIATLQAEDIKNVIRRELLADHDFHEQSNPWNLETFLGRQTRADGQLVVPVTIINGTNSFDHLLSLEQARGIAIGLDGQPEWSLYVNGVPLIIEFFIFDTDGNYLATINDFQVRFSTPELVQGLISAANWTGRDPHTLILELTQIRDDGNISLTF